MSKEAFTRLVRWTCALIPTEVRLTCLCALCWSRSWMQIGHHVGVVSEEIINRVFHVLDTDGSGTIDFRVSCFLVPAWAGWVRLSVHAVWLPFFCLSPQEFACALFVFRRGSKAQKLRRR